MGFFIYFIMINHKNKIQLIGVLSAASVFEKHVGTVFTTFTITTTESYLDETGSKRCSKMEHSCVAFNKQATFIRDQISLGSEVVVEGRLLQPPLNQDQIFGSRTVVYVNELLNLGLKPVK